MSILRRIVDWLPRDMSLPEEEFRSRHRAMAGLLLLHLPVLAVYGWSQGAELVPLAIELAPMAVLLAIAVIGAMPHTAKAFAAGTGLLYGSLVLLHLSGGAAEASLHFLIVLAFTFLYRIWSLFGWSLVLMASSYALLDLARPFLDTTGVEVVRPEMALGALVTAGSLASIGLVLAWKSAADHLQSAVAALETARERDEAAARRDAYGKMYVNLARRGQSLVDRQLQVIDDLEQDVDDPDILASVFELDHLTTRVRRHGESLLVVADIDLPNRSTEPVPLSDVVRGAQSEIEQYRRVDARIDPSIAVEGTVTRDLVHLLAELLDNATTYSPPSTTVKVHARAGGVGSVVLTIEDRGLGLTPERLAEANADLQNTEELDENSIRHLGFRVVARLAEKHGITVRLTSTNGGGVTAWVEVPADIVVSADTDNLAPARLPDPPAEQPTAEAPVPPPPVDTPPPTEQPTPSSAPTSSPTAQPPVPPSPTEQPVPAPAPPAAPSPAKLSQGFSANGRGRRGRRSRSPVSTPHDRQPSAPGAPPPPPAGDQRDGQGPTAPPERPPAAPKPLPTRAVRLPKPEGTTNPSPTHQQPMSTPPAAGAPATNGNGSTPGKDGAAALPRRERGATSQAKAKDEALDLFGELDAVDRGRSSLGDFQRGQESARKEVRE